jgi:GNAT superfamily N-acetyltransferase
MVIKEYDDVNPLSVLALNLSSLNFALTPERAANLRRLDQRPFPFFALYALENDIVAGQVGVFRLPVVTTEGPADVGGIWAVSVQPAFSRRGIATQLMKGAHSRMRAAGLHFSTLGTSRSLAAHRLYRQLGYKDVHIAGVTIAEAAHLTLETDLRAKQADKETIEFADRVYAQVAAGRLGFARRQPQFISMLTSISFFEGDIWLIRNGETVIGYALAQLSDQLLSISDLVLIPEINPAEVVASIVREVDVEYVRVRIEYPLIGDSLTEMGFQTPLAEYGTFMVKALTPGMAASDAIHLLGIGSERFMMSSMDTT